MPSHPSSQNGDVPTIMLHDIVSAKPVSTAPFKKVVLLSLLQKIRIIVFHKPSLPSKEAAAKTPKLSSMKLHRHHRLNRRS
ncbi:unnamed protein product [Linum trigynum]|uniref:Uncharacterized protein n=1 Tax=Linum trigynum TaxID=586398 RepID=A0AAV2CHC0_9ROSI